MKKVLIVAGLLMGLLIPARSVLAQTPPTPGGTVTHGVVVTNAVHYDRSLPLRFLFGRPTPPGPKSADQMQYVPRPAPGGPAQPTPAGGTSTNAVTRSMPTTGLNFDGVGQGFTGPQGTFAVNSAPPDTTGAVGPNHYVQIVNSDFAIFNKSGTVVYGPVANNTLWSGFGGGCQTNNDGDPTVEYDKMADRWVISQFSVSTTPYLQCVAVSQTGDPTGAYYRYSFPYAAFNDYPKMGVWPDGYYETFNMFTGGTTFAGAKICAYDRTRMLSGQPATQQCFDTSTSYGGLLPSGVVGSTPPPAGAPNPIVGLGASANSLAIWQFHADWTTPANSTFTGPITLTTATFAESCTNGGTCIPQAGTTQRLDSLGDRLMSHLQYRNFGDHEALVVNHSVTVTGGQTGIRWYELRGATTTPSIFQQGTYAPDGNHRWMGSIAMDAAGNMALGFSESSSSIKPQIHYTGRLVGDPAGTMTQGEGTIINGAGSQGSTLSRWGDYSSMTVDPADDCTFWYTQEYLAANGTFNWNTRIASFKYPSCGSPPPANDFSISANPTSLSLAQHASGTSTISTTVVSGSGTVSLTVSGTPSGATASVSPTSVAAGGSSTLTVSAGTAAPGSYPITVTGTEGTSLHSTSVTLTVTAPVGNGGIANGGFESGSFSPWTTAGTTLIVSSGAHSGTYAAQIGGTSPTNGDSSTSQTFTVPTGSTGLSFWYQLHCPDSLTYDWATATLKDNTAGTTTTPLPNTCSNTGAWQQVTASVTAGHSYTLTLVSHDDNYAGDATYTLYDDVMFTAPANDFSISASPTSLSIAPGASGTSTISTSVTSGSAGSVNLVVSGAPSGATASLSSASVTAGGSSTLTVNAGTAAPGNYTITVTGTEGSMTHAATVTLTVTGNNFSISASPTSLSVTQGASGTSTISTARTVGVAATVSLNASGTPAGATATLNPASVTAGSSSTLTLAAGTAAAGTYTITVTGTEGTISHTATVSLTVTAPVTGGIANGGFETGTLSGWTPSGASESVVGSGCHGGSYCDRGGTTSPTNGDSSASQTFTVPSGKSSLNVWFANNCTDTVTYDWVNITLKDNTTNVTTTPQGRLCDASGTWRQVTAAVTAGHSYTLTLINHDDNYASDPTYTLFDDVTLN